VILQASDPVEAIRLRASGFTFFAAAK